MQNSLQDWKPESMYESMYGWIMQKWMKDWIVPENYSHLDSALLYSRSTIYCQPTAALGDWKKALEYCLILKSYGWKLWWESIRQVTPLFHQILIHLSDHSLKCLSSSGWLDLIQYTGLKAGCSLHWSSIHHWTESTFCRLLLKMSI